MIDGQRLRQLREGQGFSREEFASRVNLGTAQINRYERGESDATADVLARMAIVLGVSTDYLVGLTDNPVPQDKNLQADEMALIAARRRGDFREAIKLLVPED